MNENNIKVTLTESQHEFLNEILCNASEAFQFVAPYNDGISELPLDNSIIQRYTMLENMKEMFQELWVDRFKS